MFAKQNFRHLVLLSAYFEIMKSFFGTHGMPHDDLRSIWNDAMVPRRIAFPIAAGLADAASESANAEVLQYRMDRMFTFRLMPETK
jgi:hypothetical protein